jgi:hypothetical protein
MKAFMERTTEQAATKAFMKRIVWIPSMLVWIPSMLVWIG